MKVICLLCDKPFAPNKYQARKLDKHPHKIQICANCYERISEKVAQRNNKV